MHAREAGKHAGNKQQSAAESQQPLKTPGGPFSLQPRIKWPHASQPGSLCCYLEAQRGKGGFTFLSLNRCSRVLLLILRTSQGPIMPRTSLIVALLALVACPAALAARRLLTVTFDATTGAGFVGKGDVQLAFGWNNKQLQENAGGVSFAYAGQDKYDVVCDGSRQDVTIKKTQNIAGSITYDTRVRSQITGLMLTGFNGEPVITGGTVPNVGDSCTQGGGDTISSVALTSSTSSLTVSYGGNSVDITPVAPVV